MVAAVPFVDVAADLPPGEAAAGLMSLEEAASRPGLSRDGAYRLRRRVALTPSTFRQMLAIRAASAQRCRYSSAADLAELGLPPDAEGGQ